MDRVPAFKGKWRERAPGGGLSVGGRLTRLVVVSALILRSSKSADCIYLWILPLSKFSTDGLVHQGPVSFPGPLAA